jgi:MFS family permease
MLYLLPFFANMVFAMAYFVAPVWSLSQRATVIFTGSLGVSVALSYVLANLILNRFLSPRNAPTVMGLAIFGATGLSGAALLIQDYHWMLPLVASYGFCAGAFFGPFQVVMGLRGQRQTLGMSVVRYNLSWTSGAMVGAGLAGWLLEHGRSLVHFTSLALCLVAMSLVIRLQYRARKTPSAPAAEAADRYLPDAQAGGPPMPWYQWLGWATVFVQAYCNFTVNYIFPKLANDRNFTPTQQGLAIATMLCGQLVFTVVAWRLRRRLYRPDLTVMAALCGISAFVGVTLFISYPANLLALALQGAASGTNFFLAVYYANNSGRQGSAVTINETMVGLGLTLGPAVGAALGQEAVILPYAICGALFVTLGLAAFIGQRWGRPRPPAVVTVA